MACLLFYGSKAIARLLRAGKLPHSKKAGESTK
jgi:hypothetical protein